LEFAKELLDYILHIDTHLNGLIVAYEIWTYAILFAIIFSETGLVVAPFLPGDSLPLCRGRIRGGPARSTRFWLFNKPVRRRDSREHRKLLDRICGGPENPGEEERLVSPQGLS